MTKYQFERRVNVILKHNNELVWIIDRTTKNNNPLYLVSEQVNGTKFSYWVDELEISHKMPVESMEEK